MWWRVWRALVGVIVFVAALYSMKSLDSRVVFPAERCLSAHAGSVDINEMPGDKQSLFRTRPVHSGLFIPCLVEESHRHSPGFASGNTVRRQVIAAFGARHPNENWGLLVLGLANATAVYNPARCGADIRNDEKNNDVNVVLRRRWERRIDFPDYQPGMVGGDEVVSGEPDCFPDLCKLTYCGPPQSARECGHRNGRDGGYVVPVGIDEMACPSQNVSAKTDKEAAWGGATFYIGVGLIASFIYWTLKKD